VPSAAWTSGYEVRAVLLRLRLRIGVRSWREEVVSTSRWKRSPSSAFFLAVPEFRRLACGRGGLLLL